MLKQKSKANTDADGDAEIKDVEEEDDNSSAQDPDDEITPAKVFNEQILQKAGLGDAPGDVIASFPNIPLLVPRGKYSLDLYGNYVKFHGRTHNYKIMYENIVQLF